MVHLSTWKLAPRDAPPLGGAVAVTLRMLLDMNSHMSAAIKGKTIYIIYVVWE